MSWLFGDKSPCKLIIVVGGGGGGGTGFSCIWQYTFLPINFMLNTFDKFGAFSG